MRDITAADLLRELNLLDEHPQIEAKSGSGAGKSALQTICAFSNEPHLGGGHIVFGVGTADDLFGYRYEPAGVPDPDKLQADLASQCASVFNRVVRPEMWMEEVDGKVLVCAFVPELPPGQKPNLRLPTFTRTVVATSSLPPCSSTICSTTTTSSGWGTSRT